MYEDFTPEYLKSKILEDTSTDITKIEGSFASDLASGIAYNLYELWQELGILYDMIFLDSLTGTWLDAKCGDYDITRTPGSYSEGMVNIESRYSVTIPKGTLFSCNDLEYEAVSEAIISNTGTVSIRAREAGSIYDAQDTDTIRLIVPIPGVVSVTLATAPTGGGDAETDDALLSRLKAYIKAAGSGCKNDYIKWAKEVAGVGSVEVVPTWNGAGTVKVIITDSEYRGASEELTAKVSEHIEALRPIGAKVTVTAAQTVDITVKATVTLSDNTKIEDAETSLKDTISEYLKEVAQDCSEVRISRLCGIIMQTDGIVDAEDIKINDVSANYDIESGVIPVLSEVVLSEKGI